MANNIRNEDFICGMPPGFRWRWVQSHPGFEQSSGLLGQANSVLLLYGIPNDRIDRSHQYWEPPWREMKDIVDNVATITRRCGPVDKLIGFFAECPIHPNQLVGNIIIGTGFPEDDWMNIVSRPGGTENQIHGLHKGLRITIIPGHNGPTSALPISQDQSRQNEDKDAAQSLVTLSRRPVLGRESYVELLERQAVRIERGL